MKLVPDLAYRPFWFDLNARSPVEGICMLLGLCYNFVLVYSEQLALLDYDPTINNNRVDFSACGRVNQARNRIG